MRNLGLIALLCWLPAFAALPATAQWDVRTAGSDSNGGGFDPTVAAPGTDFSAQDAAQIAFTDLVIGATTTQLTSAANPFGSTHPGNVINVTGGAGCTTGRYVVSTESGITATMDRSVGTAASTCTGNLGGGLLTLGQANTIIAGIGGSVSMIVHVKSGTYTFTSALALSTPSIWRGYGTAHSDYGTRPLWTTSTNSTNLVNMAGANTAATFDNISWSNTAGTRGDCIQATGSESPSLRLLNSIMDGCKNGINGDWQCCFTFTWLYVENSEIKNSTVDGIIESGGIRIVSSYIHNNTSHGITHGTNTKNGGIGFPDTISRSVIASNGGSGIQDQIGHPWYLDHVDLASNTSDGFTETQIANGGQLVFEFENNVVYGNGGWGVNLAANSIVTLNRTNAYGSNTSGNRNNFGAGTTDAAITAGPFTNSGAGDYSPNSTAGGGAVIRNAGFPGSFPGATMTSYVDIGAIRHQDPASSAVTVGYPIQ